ncbi:MAG TPA: hypothetical protein VGQ95_09455 [Chthoniobacterales bacterium]|nr:hypothetical protein [Chthoniobacterales bacterium]
MSILQKSLAQLTWRTEDRGAMKTGPRSLNRGRSVVAVFVSAVFLWTLAMSASPQLHQRIHPDANRTDHSCAVTFITAGNYDHSAPAPLVSVPIPAVQFSKIPALTPRWVESPFLGARIFEHAPPVNS